MTDTPYCTRFQTTAGDEVTVTVDADGLIAVAAPGVLTYDEGSLLTKALIGATAYLGQRRSAATSARVDEARRRWRSA